jgi:hypothetical protein
MAPKFVLIAVALVAVTAVVTSQAISQEGGAKQPSPEDVKKMMDEWLKLGKPGKPHEFLKSFEGKWDTKTRMQMGPGAPVQESTGTAEFEMIMGGRYQKQESTGTMMGMPYQGFGIVGYDNFRNRFDSVWLDNMGTAMLNFSGQLDRTGKVMTMYGEMDEPGLKMVGRMVKYVIKVVDDKKFVFEMYDLAAGPDYKVFDITYTRKE